MTEREQESRGWCSRATRTSQVAQRLAVSPHSVQEHLKNVFDKTGVRSRRDLVGKVFFSHDEPRLRDNERWAIDSLPLRRRPGQRLSSIDSNAMS
jgi:DNA-binding CsgD family transcriptional regulator